ncbi:MAG: hypothetical protein KAI66_09755 [Lentisphaeria bacterium]|nr:hypothetical protein [Lentisphaeria bacterium]
MKLARAMGLVAALLIVAEAWAADDPLLGSDAIPDANLLVNPSFELDEDGDGVPDGWNIHRDARGELSDPASDGRKAMRFTEGAVVLDQNLSIENLPDRQLRIMVDARSPDGAKLGVYVGCLRAGDNGKVVWRNSRLAWNRSLQTNYSTHRIQYRIPANARGPRLWIALYRSSKTGTLYIDNAKAYLDPAGDTLSDEQKLELKRIQRDWGCLQQRAEAARERVGEHDPIAKVFAVAKGVQDRCFAGDTKILAETDALRRKLGTLSAHVNRAVSPGTDLAVSFAEAYSRLTPGEIFPTPVVTKSELLAVRGEYGAVGIIVANGADRPRDALLTLVGAAPRQFECQVRKQVFLETWYKRKTTRGRVSDPLCLLPGGQGAWKLTLDPGEIAKLYVSIHCLDQSTDADAKIIIRDASKKVAELSMGVRIVGEKLPESVRFGHAAFIYPSQDHTREATAADLGSHGVDRMEFTRLPPSKFHKDGKLIEADFSLHEAWLKDYGSHVEKMMIFWGPHYKNGFDCVDGAKLELLSAPGRRALVNLLRAFFARMAQLGYGMDRFAILPFDETHSKSLQESPDENIARAVEVSKLLRQEFPGLEIMMTLTYYAFPKDVEAMAPHLDVVMPYFGWPTKLTRSAPPDYNPREAFADHIWPTLDAERRKRGMRIWSYLVAAGKSDSVLVNNRAYPIRAVGAGMTGVSTWAYNVSTGSSWDDTDGKPWVDYIFVYDGSEDHPFNKRSNPTGERVVPSIRWEALRAGIQDAKLLLHLKRVAVAATCPAELRADIGRLLDVVRAMASDDTTITCESVASVSQRAHRLYARSQ